MKLLVAFAVFSLLFTACSKSNTSDVDYDPNATMSSNESQFLTLINKLRTDNGVSPLHWNQKLQSAAKHHSLVMLHNLALDHDESTSRDQYPEDRITRAGGSYGYTGENIACGSTDAEGVFEQWENSPGHLANMLSSDYTSIGISEEGDGYYSGGDCPNVYWTTDFGGT